MGRYDTHKNPFSVMLNKWAGMRTNDQAERAMKSFPSHVANTEKDFLHIASELKSSIMTMPILKIPQQFSRFGREPTQKKDMGLASPSDYFTGAITAFSGGIANFYPRGNLSHVNFQPLSNLKAPQRNYDQHHQTGGPAGWLMKVMESQQQGSQGQSGSGSGGSGAGAQVAVARTHRQIMERRNIQWARTRTVVQPRDSSGGAGGDTDPGSGGGQGDSQSDQTQHGFDKDGKCTIQSKDTKHNITVDQKGGKITLNVPTDKTVYVGGDGSSGQYAQLMTVDGKPVINAKGRIG